MCVCVCVCVCACMRVCIYPSYGAGSINRLFKNIGLFRKRTLQRDLYFPIFSHTHKHTHLQQLLDDIENKVARSEVHRKTDHSMASDLLAKRARPAGLDAHVSSLDLALLGGEVRCITVAACACSSS